MGSGLNHGCRSLHCEPRCFGYLKPKAVARRRGLPFSRRRTRGQTRQSGDPVHLPTPPPWPSAEILADWHLDGQTLMRRCCRRDRTLGHHDEISDTSASRVAELVDASPSSPASESRGARTRRPRLRKMLLAMGATWRHPIKLATGFTTWRRRRGAPAKRRRITRETMADLCPHRHRLGLKPVTTCRSSPLRTSTLAPTRCWPSHQGGARQPARDDRRTWKRSRRKLSESGIEASVQAAEHVFTITRRRCRSTSKFEGALRSSSLGKSMRRASRGPARWPSMRSRDLRLTVPASCRSSPPVAARRLGGLASTL